DLGAIIIDAVGNDRPAVIPAGLQKVDFIAPARTVLVFEKGAGLRIEGKTLRVAISKREDLRPDIGPSGKRIVVGNRPVIAQAKNFTCIVRQVLGKAWVVTIADAHVDHSIFAE